MAQSKLPVNGAIINCGRFSTESFLSNIDHSVSEDDLTAGLFADFFFFAITITARISTNNSVLIIPETKPANKNQ